MMNVRPLFPTNDLSAIGPPFALKQNQVQKLLDSSLDIICSIDKYGCFLSLNAACLPIWGYFPQELIGKAYMDLVIEKDHLITIEAAKSIMAGNDTTYFINHYRTKAGSTIPMIWSAHWDSEEEIMYCIARDGREKKRAEAALSQSNERFELAAKIDALYDWNIAANELYWGEGLFDVFGYHAHEVQMDHWVKYLHPNDKYRLIRSLEKALKDPNTNQWKVEYRFRKKCGTYSYVLERGNIIRNDEGHAYRMVGMLQDISDIKEKESIIHQSEEKYKLLFHHSPFPMFIYSLDTLNISEVNDAAVELYQYTREELLTMSMLNIRPKEDIPKALEIQSLFKNMDKVSFSTQLRHQKKNGELMNVDVTTHEIHTKGGRHIIATINNITEKVQLQQQIVEEKIAAQKEIARTIITTQEKERSEISKELHDNVNQILTTAKLYIENIGYYPDQTEHFIQKSTALLQKSINEIRILSKALVTPTIRDIGFKETLLELLDAYRELHYFEIVAEFSFEEESIDKEIKLTLYRILQEALNNSVKYAQASLVRLEISFIKSKLVMTFEDNGVGFDSTQVKPGLGLCNIQNRVSIYKGNVSIFSMPGAGCKIAITFPIS
jgi:PAS domain S-box-containing protein